MKRNIKDPANVASPSGMSNPPPLADELSLEPGVLGNSRSHYFNLYHLAPVGYCTLSENGLIRDVNLVTATLFGEVSEVLTQQPFFRFVLEEDQEIYARYFKQLFETPAASFGQADLSQVCELRIRKKNASFFWARLEATPPQNADGISICQVVIRDISRRKQVEAALDESEDRFRWLTGDLPELACAFLPDSTLTYVNRACAEYFGCPVEHLLGRRFLDLMPEDTKAKYQKGYRSLTPSHPLRIHIHEFIRDGETRLQEWRDYAFFDHQGRLTRCHSMGVDITDRNEMEDVLRESETLFRSLFERHAAVEMLLDPSSGAILDANQAAATFYGWSQDQLRQMRIQDINTLQPDEVTREMAKARSLQRIYFEFRHRRADGSIRDVAVFSSIIPGKTKDILHSIVHDITDRKLIENAQVFLLQCGMPSTGEDFFISLARYLAETLGMDYVCIDRLEGDGLTAQTVAIYNDGKFESNVSYALKDTPCGEVVDKRVCCYPRGVRALFPKDTALQDLSAESYFGITLRNSKGLPIGLIAVIGHHPLTDTKRAESLLGLVGPRAAGELERRQAEIALRASEERFSNAFKHSSIGMALVGIDGRWLKVNRVLCESLGYSESELLDRTIHEVTDPEDLAKDQEFVRQLLAGECASVQLEKRFFHKAGFLVWGLLSISLVRNSQGQPQYFIVHIQDISARKEAEQQKDLMLDILGRLNRMDDLSVTSESVLHLIQRYTGVTAAAIRFRQGSDFCYLAHVGFSAGFVEGENVWCSYNAKGTIQCTPHGTECFCGLVIQGQFDPSNPFFSPGGSAWTNDATLSTNLSADADSRIIPRGRCLQQGYQSIAIIPIRAGTEIVGLLQLNDERAHRFSPAKIAFLEGVAGSLGIALARCQTADALRESEIRDRAILSALPDPIFVNNREGIYLDCLVSDPRILVVPPEQFLGKSLSVIHSPELASQFLSAMEVVLATQRMQIFEYTMDLPMGQRWFEMRITAMDDQRVLSIVRDVTERKKAEDELRQYKEVFDTANFGVTMSDLQGKLIYINEAMAAFHGYTAPELLGQNLHVLHHQTQFEQIDTLMSTLLRNGHFSAMEVYHCRRDGRAFPMLMTGMLVKNDLGQPLFMATTAVDITERKQLEESLREHRDLLEQRVAERTSQLQLEIEKNHQVMEAFGKSEAYNAALLATIPDLIFVLSREGRFLDFKSLAEADLLMPAEQFLDRSFDEVLPPLVSGQLRLALARLFAENSNQRFEYQMEIGEQNRSFECFLTKFKEDRALCIVHNVTERKQQEDQIRRQSGLITSLLDSIPDIIFFKSVNGVYLGCNPPFAEFIGRPREEIIGRTDYDLFGKEAADVFRTNDRLMLSQRESRHNDEWITYPNGREILLDTLKTPYWGPDGELIGILGISRDITERKQAEEQLREINRNLEATIERANDLAIKAEAANRAKSEFLASMSHELRTPLNAVIGFSQALMDRYFGDLSPKQSQYVQFIAEGGRHLLDLINDILDLSKIEAGRMELDLAPVNMVEILENSLIMVKEKCFLHRIALTLDLAPELRDLIIEADARKVKQIVFNLLSNAAKFTPDGGKIRVNAIWVEDDQGPRVEVSVKDTGIGIPAEFQTKVFEPFFQIKGGYKDKTPGTGLGLSVTRQLVELHGGTVRLESEGVNRGCCVTFWLPADRKRPVSLAERAVPSTVEYLPDHPSAVEAIDRAIIAHSQTAGVFSVCGLCLEGPRTEASTQAIHSAVATVIRAGDLLTLGEKGVDYLVLLDAGSDGAYAASQRLQQAFTAKNEGTTLFVAVATYPEDGQDTASLLQKASQWGMRKQESYSIRRGDV